MSHPKRRQFLLEPGDKLLLIDNPVQYVRLVDDFLDASGLDEEQVVFEPVSRLPIPRFVNAGGDRVERFANARPEFMWHPFMWLPPMTALRYRYHPVTSDGRVIEEVTEMEGDATWAIRVALEVIAAGMYDSDSGTWTDVLSLYGLDVEDPIDVARVEMWLRGAADDVLDSVDLTTLFSVNADREWSLRAATDLAEVFVPAEWSLMSAGLVRQIRAVLDDNADDSIRRQAISLMGRLAASVLHDVPADPRTGVDHVDMIAKFNAELDEGRGDVAQTGEEMIAILEDIAGDYEPSVAALEAAGSPAA